MSDLSTKPTTDLIICQHCKIKFEAHKDTCPICAYIRASNTFKTQNTIESNIIKSGWKNILLAVTFFMMLTPNIIFLLVDLSQNRAITWAPLAILPVFTSWIYLMLLIKLHRTPLLLGISLLILTVSFLYALNFLQNADWFIFIGLPLSIGIPVISYIFVKMLNFYKNALFKLISLYITVAVILSLYIDIVFSIAAHSKIILSWSLIVLGGSIPLIVLSLYLNTHKSVLQRWLHI